MRAGRLGFLAQHVLLRVCLGYHVHSWRRFGLHGRLIPRLKSSASHTDSAESNKIEAGHVYFVATPIGNFEDITLRALKTLKDVDVIAAEDTRHTRNLLTHFAITPSKLLSHHEHNWKRQIPMLLKMAKEGKSIAVVTDAGTPGISDPGTELAAACNDENIPLHPVPGPCAAIAALSVCGLDTGEFTFMGFLPATGAVRKAQINKVVECRHTVVLYEAPHRVEATLSDLMNAGQGTRICVCAREMTKLHEEFFRGTIEAAYDWFTKHSHGKGEFVLILGPATQASTETDEAVIERQLELLRADGIQRAEAVKTVSSTLNIGRSKVYALALKMPWDKPGQS